MKGEAMKNRSSNCGVTAFIGLSCKFTRVFAYRRCVSCLPGSDGTLFDCLAKLVCNPKGELLCRHTLCIGHNKHKGFN